MTQNIVDEAPLKMFTRSRLFVLADNSPSTQINKVVSHPTLPLTVTAHEDRHIRFFDNNTGKIRENTVILLVSCEWITSRAAVMLKVRSLLVKKKKKKLVRKWYQENV